MAARTTIFFECPPFS